MSEQPLALRLADALAYGFTIRSRDASAELRRQHSEIEQLKAERDQARADHLRVRDECFANMGAYYDMKAERDALKDMLKEYGWHHEECPQYPTYRYPDKRNRCTCGFDAAIDAARGDK